MEQHGRYLVISPVKNEIAHVRHTLDSMVAQTTKPVRWIIVDDGSTDGTSLLLDQYAQQHEFIHVIHRQPGAAREPGSPVVRAFNCGLQAVADIPYEFIVKLDCDLSFAADYFERLLAHFEADAKLGIASGIYKESSNGTWNPIPMPAYHAAGASKFIRRKCFEQIGGFVVSRGWDTVDEIRAMSLGWSTKHFPELQMKHWKPEGSGIGTWRTSMMHGEIYYMTGGGLLFFLAKTALRAVRRPIVVGALGVFCGYLRASISSKPKLVSPSEAKLYQRLLNRRLLHLQAGN